MVVKFASVHFSNIKNQWRSFGERKNRRIILLCSVSALIIILYLFSHFLLFIESRNGFSFDDPILKLFKPINFTWFTFSLIYCSIIFAILHLIDKPDQVLLAIQSYTIMVLIRMIVMYLLPLAPPKDMILLIDPFVEIFATGKALTQDLFFSGHTATIFLLFLVMENKYIKRVYLIATFLVGISVLAQHVHYTIDVFAAPFFAYVSFKLVNCVRKKSIENINCK